MKVRNRFYRLLDDTPVDPGQGDVTPAVAPEPPAEEPAGESEFWKEMVEFDDSDHEPAPIVEPKVSEEVPKAEEQPKVEEPPPAVEPPVAAPEPVKEPEPKVEPEPPVAPTPPVDYAALRAAELERLEKTYALPAEQATALLTEPETVLPKLAAKLHQEVMANVLAMVQAQLPQAVDSITTAKVRESEAKTEFYSAWPELRGYEQQVLAAGAMFRQINPTAPKEVAVQAIGQLAMQALGLTRSAPQAQPAAPPPPQATPFTPAGGRSGGTPPPKPAPTVWDEMMQVDAYD